MQLNNALNNKIGLVEITQPSTGATLTLADNSAFVTTGPFSLTFNITATTVLTLPTSGTLATIGNLGAYLPLAGGALIGAVTNTNQYLFQPTTFVTTMSQTGILATITGLSSTQANGYVVPATGSPFTIMTYQGTTTVPTNFSQTITAGTACTVYYYANGSPIDTPSFVAGQVILFNNVRYLTIGSNASVTYIGLKSNTSTQSFTSAGVSTAPLNASNQSASQSTTTVTGVGTSWDSSYIGHMIRFATGSVAWITNVGSTTSMTVTPSQTVAATDFDIPGKTTTNEATSMDGRGNFGTVNAYINGSLTMPDRSTLITSGGNSLTFTTSGTTNSTLPAGTTTLVPTTGTGATGTWGINITGNAATVTTNANLTGIVTSIGNTTSIANGAISNALLANSSLTVTAGTGLSGGGIVSLGGSTTISLVNLTGDITSVGSVTTYNSIMPLSKGGTNANLTASNGAVAYSTATALALSAVGSSGQLFQSTGVGAPGWTTATYPTTAGSSGKILQSNGTNFVSSTPTFPTTAGTAGKVLISDGTNIVSSTPTYPNVATGTGTILRADGTNWSATTSTYPNTNAINTLLYASAANVMSALATANSGVLVTDSGGIPSISSTLPSGIAATNMSLTTPTLGVATATSINKVAITAPATSATLTIANGLTLGLPAIDQVTLGTGNIKTFVAGAVNVAASTNVASWTPGVSFGAATIGVLYSFQSGRYSTTVMPNGQIKTECWGSFGLTSKGISTGNVMITGFPTTTGSNATQYIFAVAMENSAYGSGGSVFADMTASATTATLRVYTNSASNSTLTNTVFNNTSVVKFYAVYWND